MILKIKKEWRCKNCFTNHEPEDPDYSFWRCNNSECKNLNHDLLFKAYILLALVAGIIIVWMSIHFFLIPPQQAYRKLVLGSLRNEEGGQGVISKKEEDHGIWSNT